MTPLQKPEWIALADSDKPAAHNKMTKALPILAIAITAAIIGAGSIFAQPQELAVANADPISVAAPQSTSQAESVDPIVENIQPLGTENNESQSAPESPANSSLTPINPKKPTISTMPTKTDDDEGDDD